MKVAITVWGDRISPVFDSAQTLLIAEVNQTEIINRQIEKFQVGLLSRLISLLEELDVEVLICGALSDESAILLDASAVEVIPFITGRVELVLSLYAKGMDLVDFTMPGCPRNRCCRMKRCENGQQRIGRYWS